MSHYYDNEPSYPSGGNPWRNPDSEKNHLGSWALALGMASIFCCGIIFGVTAIVLGLQAQAAADRGEATNRGVGTAGIVLGIIGFCATLIYLFVQMRGSGV